MMVDVIYTVCRTVDPCPPLAHLGEKRRREGELLGEE